MFYSRMACHIEVFVPVFYDLLYCIFALKQWLFGYELTDTLLVFAKSSINILASKKKIDFLKPLQEAQKKHEGFPAINLHLRDKVLFIYLCESLDSMLLINIFRLKPLA